MLTFSEWNIKFKGKRTISIGEFQPTAKHAERGCADFCLITNDDINQVKKEMERNGVEVIAGIIKTEGAQGEMKSIYVYDPDGNLVEIASYL